MNLPPFGPLADARVLGELAWTAEDAGWDGFFLWDHIAVGWREDVADAWIALAAAAAVTTRIRLGTLVTPLARRRPWKLARETVTLDRMSNGRLTLGVGLGLFEEEFGRLGDEPDPRVRGEMLDEGLDVLTGLWSGEPFSYAGKHYRIEEAQFTPAPVQTPRIPVWVAGMWPNRRPFRRAARWDGVFPIDPNPFERSLSPDDFRAVVAYIGRYRTTDAPFDVVHGQPLPLERSQARDLVAEYADAGVTWWMEGAIPGEEKRGLEERIGRGPPR